MRDSEQFQDWVLRYGHLLKKRYTKGQKQRFLKSFLTDLTAIRQDVALRKDKADKDAMHVVVGDLKKAKTVIATYYDTPAVFKGDYYFFDVDKQKNSTTIPIIVNSVIMLAVGILLTIFFSVPLFETQGLSWKTILMFLFYFVYFLLFGRVTRGWPSKNTLIRNNSSLLFLLDYIQEHPDSRFAFVFYDNGVQGTHSIQKVVNKLDLEKQKLILLDSVGAEGELYRITPNRQKDPAPGIRNLQYSELAKNGQMFLAAAGGDQTSDLHLSKEKLQAKQFNEANFKILSEYFSKIERG